MTGNWHNRHSLLAGTAMVAATLMAIPAHAQDSTERDYGLKEIIVTAQKREQSLQDVPIAVTALGADTLQVNRVTNVVDLSGLAPGVNVRTSAGGSKIPIVSTRATNSIGVVPGSDKQVSFYLDGVYISSPRGSIFDLPDVERIEMLRGPQGTLFGRNATAGALSIYTRDPTGDPSVKATVTLGNQDHRRFRLSASTPEMGPFSAYFSYVHEQRRGDIRNLGAGTVWDRAKNSLDARVGKIAKAATWLGSKDSDSYFAALKFESGDFKTVYKYDRSDEGGTPEAVGFAYLNRSAPLTGALMGALIDSQPSPIPVALMNKRPKAVANSYSIPTDQTNQGHSLTSTYVASDNITIKNILAYRKSWIFATSPIDGVSALTFTQQGIVPYATLVASGGLARAAGFGSLNPAGQAAVIGTAIAGASPAALAATVNGIYALRGGTGDLFATLSPAMIGTLTALATQPTGPAFGQAAAAGARVGQPFIGIASGAQARSKQWSDELQINYDSDLLTATVGGMWVHSKDYSAEQGLQNTISFDFIPGGVLPNKNIGQTFNKATSIAAYAQTEVHVTPQIDLVLGGRITKDKKTGRFTYGATLANLTNLTDKYKDTQFNYLVGINYKPTDDLLLYAKWSTAYVSGGSIGTLSYDPEKARSAEAGFKGQFFDRKLRANLALWWVEYKNVQGPQSATSFAQLIATRTGIPGLSSAIGTFVLDLGTRKGKGMEFEFDAAPFRGATIGGALSYTDASIHGVPADVIASYGGAYVGRSNIPKWQGNLYGQYESEPLFGDAYLSVRVDGIFTDDVDTDANPNRTLLNQYPAGKQIDAYWIVNGRMALREINLGGIKAELALWGRNLLDTERVSYGLNLSDIFFGVNYIPARSYGLDLTVSF